MLAIVKLCFSMSNIFDMEKVVMTISLSYREKSLYASLVAELIVYGPYFFLHRQNSVNKVAGMIIAIVVLQIILQSIIAAFTRNRITDERDRLIELRGYRVGYFTLTSLMVRGWACCGFMQRTVGFQSKTVGWTAFSQRLLRHAGHCGYHEDRHAARGLPENALMPPPRNQPRYRIRNQIRELRAEQKMTQQELADQVGVTRQTAIAIEQDKYSPSLETAFKVARVLGVTLEQCFQYEADGKR
jgi:DNA-binding XRE family transcriptional regulator